MVQKATATCPGAASKWRKEEMPQHSNIAAEILGEIIAFCMYSWLRCNSRPLCSSESWNFTFALDLWESCQGPFKNNQKYWQLSSCFLLLKLTFLLFAVDVRRDPRQNDKKNDRSGRIRCVCQSGQTTSSSNFSKHIQICNFGMEALPYFRCEDKSNLNLISFLLLIFPNFIFKRTLKTTFPNVPFIRITKIEQWLATTSTISELHEGTFSTANVHNLCQSRCLWCYQIQQSHGDTPLIF